MDLIKNKFMALDCIIKFIKMIKTHFGKNIKIFRYDNGSEFTLEKFKKVRDDLGIIHQFSCPYSPNQNGRT